MPTLLTWERIAKIDSQANFAQQNDTAIDRVPAHAYLTLNRDGSYATAWRLPNTYIVADRRIKQHSHTGNAKKIRKVIRDEIAQTEQRGSLGDTASLRSGRRYFTEDPHRKSTPFAACDHYLRKLGRRDGDLIQRRYFHIGQRFGMHIFEPYNIQSELQATSIHQRLIWQESQDDFKAMQSVYGQMLEACGERTET